MRSNTAQREFDGLEDVSPQIIAAHADHRREDFFAPRTQSRYSGKLIPSEPPFKPSLVRNLIGALVGALA